MAAEPVSGNLWWTKVRLNALLVLLGIAACLFAFPRDAPASFIASDFEFVVTTEPTFKPGDKVIVDGIFTNVSSQTAVFGGNIAEAGASFFFFIDGVEGLASPYFEGISGSFFPNQSIAPGGSVQFPFIFVDTTSTIPPGTIVTVGPGNLLFQNIPPSTADPFVDFYIHFSEVSALAPEPATLLLFVIGLFTMFGFNTWVARQPDGEHPESFLVPPNLSLNPDASPAALGAVRSAPVSLVR